MTKSRERNEEFAQRFSKFRIASRFVRDNAPVVVDVGAHRGESITEIRAQFPRSRIIALEPIPDLSRNLETMGLINVEVVNCAATSFDGTVEFFVNEQSHTSSLHRVNLASHDSMAVQRDDVVGLGAINQPIRVDARTIDSLLDERDVRADILKIDVQGAEADVLMGARESLSGTSVVIVEITLFDYYDRSTTFLEVENILRPIGFELFSIPFVSQNPMNGRTDWLDAIYVNTGVENSTSAKSH